MSRAKKRQQQKEKDSKINNRSRLAEITDVLRRNHITRGVTPEKLRIILEELGPTYIKLGQIMSLHSEFLPQEYCDELMKLNSEVTPMEFSEVEEVVNHSYRRDWHEIFQSIDPYPIGSASIAQVHHAVLLDGEEVIIKVQRSGIYDTMARDIGMLKQVVKLMPPVGNLRNMVDLNMVLDELWNVAQEEMDFLKEASNMEEFASNNRDIAYVTVPRLYREYTTSRVLCMEYIDGWAVDDTEHLKAAGYDLDEIGAKLVNNYIKQVMDDGFFHADPHPGNVKIRDGKIVWIDMGMMGRLTEKDRKQINRAIRGIAAHDISMIEDAVLQIGDFWGTPDRGRLYKDLRELVNQYGTTSMASIDVAQFYQQIMEIMKANKIGMPRGMSMLARGLTHMEGVLIKISPDINIMQIASARVSENMMSSFDWKKELSKSGRKLYRAMYKTLDVPSLLEDVLEEYLKGQAKINLDLTSSEELSHLLRHLVRNVVIGLLIAALLVSSSIICTTDMRPKIYGIPALGFVGYLLAFAGALMIFIRHLMNNHKK